MPTPDFRARAVLWLGSLALSACAHAPAPPLTPDEHARLLALLPADALLLGEQHDAPAHQQLQRQVIQTLATRGQLQAVAIEMAEQGHHTRALPRDASEAEARAALAWNDQAWPWRTYGPVVMTAVRAGVPVWGANLPRAEMQAAMRDASLDTRLPAAALAEQEQRIRDGHCGALPERQIRPMTRVQIARDRAMADTVLAARQAGRTVLLIAGNGHVQRELGVPVHLPADFKSKVISAQAGRTPPAIDSEASQPTPTARVDLVWPTPPAPPRDHCAVFHRAPPAASR